MMLSKGVSYLFDRTRCDHVNGINRVMNGDVTIVDHVRTALHLMAVAVRRLSPWITR